MALTTAAASLRGCCWTTTAKQRQRQCRARVSSTFFLPSSLSCPSVPSRLRTTCQSFEMPDLPSSGLIERKLAERRKRQAQQQQQQQPQTEPAPHEALPPGPELVPLPATCDSEMPTVAELQSLLPDLDLGKKLSEEYLAVNTSYPGLRILHLDPPVLVCDDFLSEALCDELTSTAAASDMMKRSAVGSDNLSSSSNASASERRTSTSLLVDAGVSTRCPGIAAAIEKVQEIAKGLVVADTWYPAGQLPPPQQICFESPQLARYNKGQHFLAHEDAFPFPIARSNKFQRAATLLVYLNDVSEGGRTRFEHLNVAVKPKKGRALLFFPSFSDGRPDARTLHTAVDAEDEKWVTQIWIAKGWREPASTGGGRLGGVHGASSLLRNSSTSTMFPGLDGIRSSPTNKKASGLVYSSETAEPVASAEEKSDKLIATKHTQKKGKKSTKSKRPSKPRKPGGGGFA